MLGVNPRATELTPSERAERYWLTVDVTVPCGERFGLPVGMSIFGRAWSEPMLLRIAFAYEQATRHRRAPKFLATANLSASS